LALTYDSGAGNGPFGLGWSVGLPSISRKTDKGLPQYDDANESDVFLLSGSEDLVPVSGESANELTQLAGRTFDVRCYRPRIEGSFARIERWTEVGDPANSFWRSITRDNITAWYGRDTDSRVFDPSDPQRIFQWLICQTNDDKGNVSVYGYVTDNSLGVDITSAGERNRKPEARGANRYLKRIRYGNLTPYLPKLGRLAADTLPREWLFEAVFDYGDHSGEFPSPQADRTTQANPWPAREDAFSNHRPGFELRTYRLCRRVLMFHHFAQAPGVGVDCIVRSTVFDYALPGSAQLPEQRGFTLLRSVTHRSHQRNPDRANEYESRDMPPVSFSYSPPVVSREVQSIAAALLENLPVGLQGPGYRWIDLDGEGLSGVLAEQAGGWFYKPNLGDGNFGRMRQVAPQPAMTLGSGSRHQFMDLSGNGDIDLIDFGGPTPGFHERDKDAGWRRHVPFASLPNIDWQDPNLRFVDLTGDGHADALVTEHEVFTWYPSMDERGFAAAHRTGQQRDEHDGPQLVFADGTQTIFLADMCGDGLTDLVRIRNGEVCYWPNMGYGHFGRKVTLGNSPRFDHPDLFNPDRIRLTDIDGSGPIDIIYLGRDGARLYFNRSGNSLSDALTVPLPLVTENLGAVQVADLLGNGTACLVWNSHLPADAARPVRYIDLMGGARESSAEHRKHEKPHLLVRVDNHLGATTEIEYTPSTRFYLQDQQAGTPWITRLPFPVHCVSKVIVRDSWRKTEFASIYSYHHGYFDGTEREFRGFGRVEQWDTQVFRDVAAANLGSGLVTQDQTLYQAPVKTVTWFHTGIALERKRVLSQFEREYFPKRFATRLANGSDAFFERELPEPELPHDLSPVEWREALRACKGMVLRQEVYELDLTDFAAIPSTHTPVRLFSAATHNCRIQRLQEKGANRHAVFLVTESEALSYHYELAIPKDSGELTPHPRIAHTIQLRHDNLGNLQQAVTIAYPRWKSGDFSDLPRPGVIADVQAEEHIAYTEIHYTRDVELPDRSQLPAQPGPALRHHRLRLPCETLTYELAGISKAGTRYYTPVDFAQVMLSDVYGALPGAPELPEDVVPKAYHEQLDLSIPCKRLVEHTRTLYFDDARDTAPPDNDTPLPFGRHGPRGLKYQDYKLALTDALLDAVFASGDALGHKLDWEVTQTQGANPPQTCRQLLRNPAISGYVAGPELGMPADQLWMRSGTAGFAGDAHQHFFLPERYTDPFGNPTVARFDSFDLFIESSTDAFGNSVAVEAFDYRVLAPTRLRDANRNIGVVAFDIRGLPVAGASLGKVTVRPGQSESTQTGDRLDEFRFSDLNPEPDAVKAFFIADEPLDQSKARRWLGKATARFVYHFGDEQGTAPPGACSMTREKHERDRANTAANRIPLQIGFEYSDGGGQVFVKKQQAEPDPDLPASQQALRWITNGKTIVNNKGKAVLQYEPYFSPTGHRFQEPMAHGVSPVMFYDAVGRLVRTEMPDGTFSRVEYSPWVSRSHDPNDTMLQSRWRRERGNPDTSVPLRRDVAGKLLDGEDFRAAWLAALHAETPAQTHFDSLGREVVAIAHNRLPGPARRPTLEWSVSDWDWADEFYQTYTKLDAEGKPLWIRDARGNLVMQYITPAKPTRWADAPDEDLPAGSVPCYDIAGNLLLQHSMDAGSRWMLMDAAGKPMFAWDYNDSGPSTAMQARLYRTEYDALHRPVFQWLRVDAAAPALIEAFEYCDTLATRDAAGQITLQLAQDRNLISQAVSHFDPSGLATVERIGLQGQAAHVTRRLILPKADGSAGLVDWSMPNRDKWLEQETFHHITEFDALGRMTKLYNWHRDTVNRVAVYAPAYNERGALRSERLFVRATKTTNADGSVRFDPDSDPARSVEAIQHISYNAKGQKLTLELGNGTRTRYQYDDRNFRLTHLYTRRDGRFTEDCENARPPTGLVAAPATAPPDRRCGVQNLHYTYDPVGNITHIRDDAQQTVYFKNSRVDPSCSYTYDALYRLVEATGREHHVQELPPIREGSWPTGSFPSSDRLRNYTQRYRYDEVGNFLEMAHRATDGDWTRHYRTHDESNRLDKTWMGGSTTEAVIYRHDAHGSMLNLNRLDIDVPPPIKAGEKWGRQIQWDWRDMIRGFDLGGGGLARYHYSIDKQRTRKHITRNPQGGGTLEEDRVYLGGYELYRRRNSQQVVVEEIESVHLFEGEERVLQLDDVIATEDSRPDGLEISAQTLFRYQYANQLGTAGLELDHAARIISYEEFHPYGTSAYRRMNIAIEAPAKRYEYTGMEKDSESGLGYHGARHLFCAVGRWISVDPVGIADGTNRFRYVKGNPISNSDQRGRQTEGTMKELSRVARRDLLAKQQLLGSMSRNPEQYPNTSAETREALRAEINSLEKVAGKWEAKAEQTRDFNQNVVAPVSVAVAALGVGGPILLASAGTKALGLTLAGGALWGGGFSAVRQGAQMLDDTRPEWGWDGSEIISGAGWGGALAPLAVSSRAVTGAMAILGGASAASEAQNNHYWTAAVDATGAALMLKGVNGKAKNAKLPMDESEPVQFNAKLKAEIRKLNADINKLTPDWVKDEGVNILRDQLADQEGGPHADILQDLPEGGVGAVRTLLMRLRLVAERGDKGASDFLNSLGSTISEKLGQLISAEQKLAEADPGFKPSWPLPKR